MVIGRHVMTCCADDIAYNGLVCIYPENVDYKTRDWLYVTAKVVIEEHKLYRCNTIGIGMPPMQYLESIEAAREFIKIINEPIKKIRDAGLKFGYHNHAHEFKDFGGVCIYDLLIEECPDMDFIIDTYWVKHAGRDYLEYLKLLHNRIENVHFKDMITEPEVAICPCGKGVIDFAPVVELCNSLSIPYALVEQDNAPSLGDEFEQMKFSYDSLKHLF
jgi:sugar phosphate isomerase/epimerase